MPSKNVHFDINSYDKYLTQIVEDKPFYIIYKLVVDILQLYELTPSIHNAPFIHGPLSQSSMFEGRPLVELCH